MPDLIQIVQPEDDATIVVDLNTLVADPDAPEGFLVTDDSFDFGRAEPEVAMVGEDEPDVVDVTWPPGKITMTLYARSTGYDALREMVDGLNRVIAAGGYVLRWKPEGSAQWRYADLLPSPIDALLRDDEDQALHVLGQFIDPGYPLELNRRGVWRGEPIRTEDVAIDNGAGRGVVVENPGTAPGLLVLRIEPDAGKIVQVKVAERSQGDLTDFVQKAVWAASTMDPKVNTVQVADAAASGGQAMKSTFPVNGLQRRLRDVRVPTTDSTFRGLFRVYASLKANMAADYRVQVRYAQGDRNPAETAIQPVLIDGSELETFHYVDVPVGDVWFPDGGPVTVELWAGSPNPAAELFFSDVALVPIDERFGTFSVPGFAFAATNLTRWDGSELRNVSGAPVQKNDTRRLDTVGDKTGRPDGPVQVEVGRHRVRAKVEVKNQNETADVIGYLRVYQGGGVVAQRRLKGRKDRVSTMRTVDLFFDAADGVAYDFVVEMTAKPAGSQARLVVHWIDDAFQRYAGAGDAFVIDGKRRRAYLDADGEAARLSAGRGGFPQVAPGQGVVQITMGDDPDTGYRDLIEKEALAKHVPTRSGSLTIDVIPRYY